MGLILFFQGLICLLAILPLLLTPGSLYTWFHYSMKCSTYMGTVCTYLTTTTHLTNSSLSHCIVNNLCINFFGHMLPKLKKNIHLSIFKHKIINRLGCADTRFSVIISSWKFAHFIMFLHLASWRNYLKQSQYLCCVSFDSIA